MQCPYHCIILLRNNAALKRKHFITRQKQHLWSISFSVEGYINLKVKKPAGSWTTARATMVYRKNSTKMITRNGYVKKRQNSLSHLDAKCMLSETCTHVSAKKRAWKNYSCIYLADCRLVKITVFNFMVSLFALLLCHLSTFKYTFQAFYQYHVNKVGKEKRKGGTSKEIQDDSDKRTTEEIFDKLSDYYEVVKTASYIFTFICFYFLGLLFVGFVHLLYIPHTDSCVCSSSMGAK